LRATRERVAAYAKGNIVENQGILALTNLITSPFLKADHRCDHRKTGTSKGTRARMSISIHFTWSQFGECPMLKEMPPVFRPGAISMSSSAGTLVARHSPHVAARRASFDVNCYFVES